MLFAHLQKMMAQGVRPPTLSVMHSSAEVAYAACGAVEVILNVYFSTRKLTLCACIGDFAVAIETLVTAISLIKQSKIASDDRCKILISALQDTLHGIESKSYGSKLALLIIVNCCYH